MRDPKDFDPNRPLIMARDDRVGGHALRARDLITVVDEPELPGQLTADQARHLWVNGLLVYEDRATATPVESPEAYAARVTEVDELGHGKFMIRAPWLGEGEQVPADRLADRRKQIVEEGAALHRERIEDVGIEAAAAIAAGTDGFTLNDNGNGNFEITGPGLEEPVKVRGRANAEDKLAELRTAALKAEELPPVEATAPGTAEVTVPPGAVTDATEGTDTLTTTTDPAAEVPTE